MATALADGVSLSSVRLHLDAAFYDFEQAHGRPNRVPLAWLRGRFRREFPGELPGEDFDGVIRAAVLSDARYDLFPDPLATAEETAGGVAYDGVVAVFVGRIDDQYLSETEQHQADVSAFAAAFAEAFHEAATEGEGDVVPIAAIRMTLDGYGDEAFDAGLLAVLVAGEYVLVEIRGCRPSRMIRAGALDVDGREWFWVARRPAWGRGGKGGAL